MAARSSPALQETPCFSHAEDVLSMIRASVLCFPSCHPENVRGKRVDSVPQGKFQRRENALIPWGGKRGVVRHSIIFFRVFIVFPGFQHDKCEGADTNLSIRSEPHRAVCILKSRNHKTQWVAHTLRYSWCVRTSEPRNRRFALPRCQQRGKNNEHLDRRSGNDCGKFIWTWNGT